MKIEWLQKIIDKIRQKPDYTKLAVYKYEAYKLHKDETKTLILGSSHLANAYVPEKGEFNFALPSQDLYYSYNLYKKLNTDNIKNVIVSFSVFSQGLQIVRTMCADFCIPYKLLLGIDYQNSEYAKEKNLYALEAKFKKKIETYRKHLKLKEDYLGDLLRYPKTKFDTERAQNRATKHYKNNSREESQMIYCQKLIEETRKNNQNLYFVLSPVMPTYRCVLPDSKIIFKELYEICEKYQNTKILDYYSKDILGQEYFANEDHLNQKGAYKLAQIIRKEL